jgi:SET domain
MAINVDDVSELLFSNTPAKLAETILGGVAICSSSKVVHGRGLVAKQDISIGDCLFVLLPTVSTPIESVFRICQGKSVEKVAETVLLKNMKRSLRSASKKQAASFMILTTGEENYKGNNAIHCDKDILNFCLGESEPTEIWWDNSVPDNTLLAIMRHNAFGPDFHNYNHMEANPNWNAYQRILGLYPLAAMINHSCQPNAVRVFSGEVMLVHACAPIAKDEEIVWSYIPPTQSYITRQNLLREKFGFLCICPRCTKESELGITHEQLDSALLPVSASNMQESRENLEPWIHYLENKMTLFSNDLKHSLRTSYLSLYLNYINASLLHGSLHEKEIMTLVMQLHLSLTVCDNASTEHLSLLHLGYDLATNKTFWVQQLQRAHIARYGALGGDLSKLRQCFQHTKGILRTLDGFHSRRWHFL